MKTWVHSNKEMVQVPAATLTESSKQGCGSVFIWYGSGSGSSILGWIPIRIRIQSGAKGFDDQIFKKVLQLKKITFYLIKNYNLPIPRPPSKLQKKPLALKRKHPALQNMKFLKFFLLLWVIFALLDPDPDS
jgi:hypothetical protein